MVGVEPIAGSLGAVLKGIQLGGRGGGDGGGSGDDLDVIRRALAEHLVVALPDQALNLDELEKLTDELGGRDRTPFVAPLEGRPYVIRVIKEPEDQLNFANAWHSDLSYLPEPPSYTVLHAWDVPPYGGDTVWANMYSAYETLSVGLRRALLRLRAVHSAGMAYGTGGLLDQTRGLSSMSLEPSAEA
ncbi:MAG: TauD/TfdA dioxygenase family protein, partial [Acidimicrobiales bacterium]